MPQNGVEVIFLYNPTFKPPSAEGNKHSRVLQRQHQQEQLRAPARTTRTSGKDEREGAWGCTLGYSVTAKKTTIAERASVPAAGTAAHDDDEGSSSFRSAASTHSSLAAGLEDEASENGTRINTLCGEATGGSEGKEDWMPLAASAAATTQRADLGEGTRATSEREEEAITLDDSIEDTEVPVAASRSDEEEEEEPLCEEEAAQEAKIVFYYPSTRPPEEKRSHVGLIEGLVTFTSQFSDDSGPLRSIHTDNHVIVTKEVEPNYWLTMVFNSSALTSFCVPSAAESATRQQQQQHPQQPQQQQSFVSRDKKLDEDVQEMLLMGILMDFYNFFRLLHGRFALFLESAEGGRRELLEDLLEDFCPAFTDSLDIQNFSVFHALGGYHFGPVDRLPYLHLISFFSLLQSAFPCILHAAAVLHGCLLFSTFDPPASTADEWCFSDYNSCCNCSRFSSEQALGGFHGHQSVFITAAETAAAVVTVDAETIEAPTASAATAFPAPSVMSSHRNDFLSCSSSSSPSDHKAIGFCEVATNNMGETLAKYDFAQTLYRYLMHVQGCAAVDAEKLKKPPYGRVNTGAARPGGGYSSFGRAACETKVLTKEVFFEESEKEKEEVHAFLFGPVGKSVFMPVVHLPDDSSGFLLVMEEGFLQIILILSEDHADSPIHDAAFLQHLRKSALDAGLRELEALLSREFFRVMQQPDIYRFVYFNHVNHAVRVSNKAAPADAVPQFAGCCLTRLEVFRIAQLHRRFTAAAVDSLLQHRRKPVCCCCCCLCSANHTSEKHCKVRATTEPITTQGNSESTDSNSSIKCNSVVTQHCVLEQSCSVDGEEVEGDDKGSTVMKLHQQPQQQHRSRFCCCNSNSNKKRGETATAALKVLAVRDGQTGWLIGSLSLAREYFLALEDPKATLTQALAENQRFSCLHLASIFM